jgi:dipeptidyl aminopeptidase/acylaminoacyl peptidase
MAGRWGELDVADCAAGVRHVLAEGLADAERVVAMGSSAGGFTALLLLAHHPELFAGGVALSAVADIVELGERSHRFERHYNDSLVGPLPGAWALQRGRSPLAAAERITAPLLLLHGDADDVVPVEQARALADRLRTLGRQVELHIYEGEGHGWGRPETVIDELTRIERFLAHHVLHVAAP